MTEADGTDHAETSTPAETSAETAETAAETAAETPTQATSDVDASTPAETAATSAAQTPATSGAQTPAGGAAHRYIEPDRNTMFLNRLISGLNKIGISLKGTQTLAVRGRTSGEWRTTPVDFFGFEGSRYLVAPRGTTQWVRNLRVAGSGELRLGRKAKPFTAVELPDEEKPAILRAYIKRWKSDIGPFFEGVGPDAPEEEIRRISANHPIFRVTLEKR